MKIETFKMERMQSTWENAVDFNLSESGVHPLILDELLSPEELEEIRKVALGYTQSNGTPELRERIARLYSGVGPDHILVTSGSSEANFLLMWSLIEPGDEVLFELPNYMQMWGLLRAFGANVKSFHLKQDANWQPDLNALKTLVTPKTKLIILTNPNNPTGAVLNTESMETIIALASKAGAWILADEVYQGAELNGARTPSFWGRYDKVLVVNGLSKAYGLPGLRIGWILADRGVIDRTWPYHDYTTISPSALSDKLAGIALSPGNRDRILARTRSILNKNFPLLEGWLKSQAGVFEFRAPQAGAICFVRYAMNVNSTVLVERLIREKSVLIVPGDHFEMDRFLRIGFGSEEKPLLDALKCVEDVLEEYR